MEEHKRSLEEVRRVREEERLIRLGYIGKYRRRNREKILARRKVYIELRAGRLKRKPCEVCGKKKSEAHHEDHSNPLEVHWLCKPHHAQADRQLRLTQTQSPRAA